MSGQSPNSVLTVKHKYSQAALALYVLCYNKRILILVYVVQPQT